MSREVRSNSNYQLRPEDYPDAKDVQEVNQLSDDHPDGLIGRFVKSKRLGLFAAAPIAGIVSSIQAQDAAEEAARTVPAGIVRGVDWALGGTQVAQADGPTPTPNPNWIDEGDPDETPHPVDPNETPAPPVPDEGPPAPPAGDHEEFYQIVHKEMFDSDGNRIPEWGVDAPWDQQFRYWEDLNRNRQPDAGEGLQSNLRTGPDGVEVIHDSILGDVEGVSVCVEDTNVDSNVQLVTPAVQCADINPASLTVEIQSLVENKKVVPPTPTQTPEPTPTPESTPAPSPEPTPTPELPGPSPTPEPKPVIAPEPTPEPTEEFKPTPTPTAVPKPEVCPDGTVLPDVFQDGYSGQLDEIKCEIIDHVEENIESHDAIKDAVGLGEGEMPIDEQIGVKPGELPIADRIDNLPTLPEIENAVDDGPDWVTRGLLIGGIAGGSVLGFLGLRSITGRLDRLIDRGQPPAEPGPSPAAEPKPRRGGPFGLFGGVFGFFGRGKRESKQEPQKPRVPKAAAVYPHPITREPKPVPAKEVLSEEAVEIFAKLMPALTAVINELRQMKDPQLVRVAKRLGEENLSLLRRAFILTGDDEREVNKLGKAKLLKRLMVKLDELSDEDKARIAQKQKELEEQKRQAAVPAH